jgi:hypothetical protein
MTDPRNSIAITKKPITQGRCTVLIKRSMVPVNPYPPNNPIAF